MSSLPSSPQVRESGCVPTGQEILAFLQDCRQGFWLDSSLNIADQGRRSFYGKDPSVVFMSRGTHVTVNDQGTTVTQEGNPVTLFFDLFDKHRGEAPCVGEGFPSGIWVGYFAYDLAPFMEPVELSSSDDLGLPEIYFGFFQDYCVLDHATKRHYQITRGHGSTANCPSEPTRDNSRSFSASQRGNSESPVDTRLENLAASFTHSSYLATVREAQEYIAAGDIYQVNLSQRFSVPMVEPPAALYLALREESPAPYGAYLKFPEFTVLSNSPERFLWFDPGSRKVQTRPIKGTRPRGATAEEDTGYANELLNSPKDRAENIMIVDLERNDLGRVCSPGTVTVSEQCVLEPFPTVFHLTSTVEGILAKDKTLRDLLLATFPGGSITGAPKIRAMEIIDELEPTRRGLYTGSLGYLGTDGSMDLSIAIRTALHQQGKLYFQVGGGIVADSDPESEYQETLTKALAWSRALARVQAWREHRE